MDVLVVGGGPAGRALAAECGRRGMRTTLLDRVPDAPWRATYGSWVAELPGDLPPSVVAATAAGRAIAHTSWTLDRDYAVLDVPALRAHLDTRLGDAGVQVRTGRVLGLAGPGAVAVDGGETLRARIVIDAGGHRQPLRSPGPRPSARQRVAAEQVAYGVVVDEATAAPLVAPGEALFMDWRPDHGEPGSPTFLYAVPLGGGAVLLEETSLARRPGLPLSVLRRRLLARLAHHGIAAPAIDGSGAVERVRFPVDTPRHRTPGVLGFGAAAPFVHPASGFSVAAALTAAPAVADVLASSGVRAAESLLWSPAARSVHRLRRIGLEAVLRMRPPEVPAFFETFFALPPRHRWAYLDGRTDLAGTLGAMGGLFRLADWPMRARLIGPALRRPAPPIRDEPAPIG